MTTTPEQAYAPAAETQHQRTQLAWTRTGLSLAALGVAEVRLLVGPMTNAALLTLGIATALVIALAVGAAGRLNRNRNALRTSNTIGGGRTPALIAAFTIGVGLIGLAATLTRA